jgi:hypothetical protein
LYHFVEFELVPYLDGDISLEVDTTLFTFESLDHIEWSLLEIHYITRTHLAVFTNHTNLGFWLDTTSSDSETHDHHRLVFSSIEDSFCGSSTEFCFFVADIDHTSNN